VDWAWAVSALAGLWFVLPEALRSARRLAPDMNLLMAVAVAGAGALGDWFEAATTAFLFSFALFLETWSVGHARASIQALLDLAPRTARVVLRLLDGSQREEDRPVGTVAPGSLIAVRPGEAVPLDGVVEDGETRVDESPLTGEPVPVFKGPGDPVLAGSVNGDGVVLVRATRPADDSAIARIMHLVREAQSRKAAVVRWVDRFALVYTPIMMGFALFVALAPPLLGAGSFSEWAMRALVVLVTACPCALAISTPVTIVAGLSAAVRRGVLIKGGSFLEEAARVRAVALDKTGTLTTARLLVRQAVPAPGIPREVLLGLAAALEAHSTHPAGRAVHDFALEAGAVPPEVSRPANLPGLGMSGEIGGRTWYAGSPRLFARVTGRDYAPGLLAEVPGQEASPPDLAEPQALIFTGDGLAGAFFLTDAIREESARAVAELKALGVEHVALLTGDARPEGERIGALAGVDAVYAGLLPGDKVAVVRELRERFGRVAMAGDGVNDAPALAAADLSLAMGTRGSGAAIETAGVALMSDDLARLPWLIRHARRTLALVRANIAFALGVKGVCILLALAGVASLWMAVMADVGSSLLVVLNGLRLLAPERKRGG
jgi:Cd2+/Zn2+-exporting ATPase